MTKHDPFTRQVHEFHEVFDLAIAQPITDRDLLALRFRLIDEEVKELKEAALAACTDPSPQNRAMMLRELGDVQCVLSGFAVSFGLPLGECVTRVHAANMSKMKDGQPLKDAQGKVLKGPDFRPPVFDDLVTAC